MADQKNSNTEPKKKAPKKKGPIRFEFIIPTAIIFGLVYAYFHFFFDNHLRKGIEYVATQANGAEVNVGSLSTSVFGGYLKIADIQVTDKNKPHRNLVQIGEIRFDLLWDALLRAKFVVEESSIINIQALTPRKSPGYVVPPGDPKNSMITKLQNQVIDQAKSDFAGNVLGDAVNLLEGADPNDILKNIESELKATVRIKELEAELKEKEKLWKERIDKLPKSKEIQELADRAKKVKFDKDPIKLQAAIKEVNAIVKEADQKIKYVKETGGQLDSDLKLYEQSYKELEQFVKDDIKDLENRFKIPQLDPKDMAMKIFGAQFASKLAEMRKYSEVAKQYMPPKRTAEEKAADDIIPPPRATGQSYKFGRPNSYPLFWLKKAQITSEPTDSEYSGRIRGTITDITSDPVHLGRPIVAKIAGDFPKLQILGLDTTVTLDHTTETPKQSLVLKVASYPVGEMKISDSKDVTFLINKAAGDVDLNAALQSGSLDVSMNSNIKQIEYQIAAKNKIVDEILKGVAKDVSVINIAAKATGEWNKINFDLDSNLAREIGNAIKKQLEAKIKEMREKIKAFVDDKIKAEKAKLEAELNKVKSQVTGEVDKRKAELDTTKKKAESELKGKNKGATKDLEKAGKKALDDLKKKFKF